MNHPRSSRVRRAARTAWRGMALAGLALTTLQGGEVQFLATSPASGTTSTLYRIQHAPLATKPIAGVPGQSAGLTVCGGAAFWAVNGSGKTTLHRSQPQADGVDEIGTFPATNARTTHLVSDGQMVYWSVASGTSATLYSANFHYSGANPIVGLPGAPIALIVKNQEAFWGVNETAPTGVTLKIFRSKSGAQPLVLDIRTGTRLTGLALDEGFLWVAATEENKSPTSSVVTRIDLLTGQKTTVQKTSGTSGAIEAASGRAVWDLTPPSGPPRLFSAAADGPTVRAYPSVNLTESHGLLLTPNHGLWWGKDANGACIHSFDLFSEDILSNDSYPEMSVSYSSRRGGEIQLALQPDTGAGNGLVLHFQPHGTGFASTGAPTYGTPITGLGAGRWHFLHTTNNALVALTQSNVLSTSPLGPTARSHFASGEAASINFFFAANSAPHNRGLYSLRENYVSPVTPGDFGSGNLHDPKDIRSWNGATIFTAESDWYPSRAIGGIPDGGEHISWAWPEHVDPQNLREFQEFLAFDEALPAENPEGPGRRNLLRSREGQVFSFGNPSLPARSNVLGDAQGWIFSLAADASGLVGYSPGAPEWQVPFPSPAATDPAPRLLADWKGAVFFDYRNQEGKRTLCRQFPFGWPQVLLEADEVGEMAPHAGHLYVPARDGAVETLYRLASAVSPPIPVSSWNPPTARGLRGFHSLGSALYAIAEGHPGSDVVEVSQNGLSPVPGEIRNVTTLRSFQNVLLAGTSGTNAQVFRRTTGPWTSVSPDSLGDADDFLEAAGTLFFSADRAGKRDLFRFSGSNATVIPIGYGEQPYGPNPRGLTHFRGQIVFAANSHEGRELWVYDPVYNQPYQRSLIGQYVSPGFQANPLIDGPRNITLTTVSGTSIPENLPAGSLLGELHAEGEASPEDIVFSGSSSAGPLMIEGHSLRIAQPITQSAGEWFGMSLMAANPLGIFSRQELWLPIRSQRDLWIEENFPEIGAETGNASPLDDPDADGTVNLLERAFARNPREGGGSNGPAGLPRAELIEGESGPQLELPFQAPLGFPSDLTYEIRSSNDLKTWTTEGALFTAGPGNLIWTGKSSALEMTHRFDLGVSEFRFKDVMGTPNTRRFLRIQVLRR